MDIQQLLGGALGQQATQLISNQLGIDANQAQNAVNLALPTILSALNRNASTQDGADALTNAIANNHSGGGLNDLSALAQTALGGDGASILQHIFGGAEQNVSNVVSQNAGISGVQSSQIMQILAPMVLNALGNQSQANAGGINVGSITSILSNFVGNQTQQTPHHRDIISKLIDRNGDGNVADDVVGMLKGFFNK
ncbi:MAG TPA: DUF937 domain-containing protein [Chitinophagales bacterium]|nr:DUF937 domain-containing protein [Chitinophagales bacterium]